MSRRARLVFLAVLFGASPVRAASYELGGFYEAGKRSTADDYSEEDDDDLYSYDTSHLKIGYEPFDLHDFGFSSFVTRKNYDLKNELDNVSRLYSGHWTGFLKKEKDTSLRARFRARYRQKRFGDNPAGEYDQAAGSAGLDYKSPEGHSLGMSAGADNYNYLAGSSRDQLKFFGEAEAKAVLLEKKLELESGYKVSTARERRLDRKRTQQEVSGGMDALFGHFLISRLRLRGAWGQRDTKDGEERDEDRDFEFWRAYARTDHPFLPWMGTHFKLELFKKDYVDFDLDHSGFEFENGWDWRLFSDGSRSFTVELDGRFKELEYDLAPARNYRKKTLESRIAYRRKRSWKASAGVEGSFYDYSNPANDKTRAYVLLSGEKSFLDGKFSGSLDLKFRFTDNKFKEDDKQQAARVSVNRKF
ncbi:MAG: hypothetical protein A2902_03600 [Elusimicrobia bacterium RIFCSPLOWO2_01_FULL_64_13]|nr:MAG: hypothetical protein A2902_03600 [Elusimicrobia bacterium RIFCSPLOWO2_01_FULL_64_13]